MSTKRRVRLDNSDEHRIAMKNASKAYKKTLSVAYNKYQRDFQKRIRNLKSSNPRDYWNIINRKCSGGSGSNLLSDISSEVFFEHFKNLNSVSKDAEHPTSFVNTGDTNNALNSPFTVEEIVKCIKELKHNKACGQDHF